jgi:hypothetical protein
MPRAKEAAVNAYNKAAHECTKAFNAAEGGAMRSILTAITHGLHIPVPAPSTHEDLAEIPLSLSAGLDFSKERLDSYINKLDDELGKAIVTFSNHEGKQAPKVVEHLNKAVTFNRDARRENA